ncbi:MAG TPA: helix-turn-helix domain-containing protein [Roseomonas sp.]|nr:helix-turn-helix domain-containing protein [Roseomonas sp.]
MGQDGIAIGELSRRTGCNIETIRYYERVGILPTPARRGRYRLYGTEDVRRLAFVRRARELGFNLDDVRALLGLGDGACSEARSLAAAHLADVRARIADLKAMERVLADTVRQCDAGGEASCPVIEVLGGLPARPRQALR